MSVFIFRRFLTLIATLVGASLIIFLVLDALPGNAAQMLMGAISPRPKFAAVVCRAGGLGCIEGISSPDKIRQQIRELRSLTDAPFTVNFPLAFGDRSLVEGRGRGASDSTPETRWPRCG